MTLATVPRQKAQHDRYPWPMHLDKPLVSCHLRQLRQDIKRPMG